MIVETREINGKNKWIAYVWDEGDDIDPMQNVSTEEVYVEMNDWCKDNLHYHARTAFNVFEFKTEKDLSWFMLRWL